MVARDDEGNAVELGEGPPSLFPVCILLCARSPEPQVADDGSHCLSIAS